MGARISQRSAVDPFFSSIQNWISWTPIWGNTTVGNGIVDARYTKIGGAVLWRCALTLGTTSVIGTSPSFSAPLTALGSVGASVPYTGTSTYLDVSLGGFYIGLNVMNTNGIDIYLARLSETQLGLTATTPFTWASGDILRAQGFYEVAQ